MSRSRARLRLTCRKSPDYFGFLALPSVIVISIVACGRKELLDFRSLSYHPSSLLARHLGVVPIVLVGVLNRRHAVDSWGAFELNALVRAGSRSPSVVFLENAFRGARVGVRVGWHLQRREFLCRGAGSRRRDGSTRNDSGRLEGQ
jgi:hypothetical protein